MSCAFFYFPRSNMLISLSCLFLNNNSFNTAAANAAQNSKATGGELAGVAAVAGAAGML